MTAGDYPDKVPEEELIPPETFASDQDFPKFRDIAPQLGLNVFDLSGGAIVEDFDGDGNLDILTSTWDSAGQIHYFKNEGDGRFTEKTAEAGLLGILGGLNLVHSDFDNDGDADVLVLRGAWLRGELGRHPNSLLRNDGSARFTDVTFEVGLGENHYPSQTAAWSDYDLDGDLDLYVGNEATKAGPFASQLFRNDGLQTSGYFTFTDVATAAGVENLRYSKGVTWGDVNGDRYPDLYVSNLAGENRLYINRGDGSFEDRAESSGVLKPMESFPTWFWDFDNDGDLDLYVSSFHQAKPPERLYVVAASYLGLRSDAETQLLYENDGLGRFRDVTKEQNLQRVTMPMGSNFGDLDNDGYLDFYLGTGYPFYDGLMPNVMYRNRGGEGFADITSVGGFGHLQKGHGIAFADLDNDGDQDVFEQMGGAFPGDAFGNALYENPGLGNHWLKLELVGQESNRSGIGNRVRITVIENGRNRVIHRHVSTGGSFGSNPLMQHIGLGKASEISRLEIYWPASDTLQTFHEVSVNRRLRVVEGENSYQVVPEKSFLLTSSEK
jgi:hypothetical protein